MPEKQEVPASWCPAALPPFFHRPFPSCRILRKQIRKLAGIAGSHFLQLIPIRKLGSGFVPLDRADVTGKILGDLVLRYPCPYTGLLKWILRVSSTYPDRYLLFFS